jgi:SAM-dependent methyltransferase
MLDMPTTSVRPLWGTRYSAVGAERRKSGSRSRKEPQAADGRHLPGRREMGYRDGCQYERVTDWPRRPAPLSVGYQGHASVAPTGSDGRLHHESQIWLAPFIEVVASAGPRVLDLGCGQHYADALFLAESGFAVFACDRVLASPPVPAVHPFTADISQRLPVRTAAVDAVLASLSLHYFPWATTIDICEEIYRVVRPGGLLMLRVNADDDLNYGAGIGEEIEPGYFRSSGEFGLPRKRFFTEGAIRAALSGFFNLSHLTHRTIDRYGAPKQVWECLAARAPDAP